MAVHTHYPEDRDVNLSSFFLDVDVEDEGESLRSDVYTPPIRTPSRTPNRTPIQTDFDTMKEVAVVKETAIMVPIHPIPSMQDAFAESMREAAENTTPTIKKARSGNASVRRQNLLDQDTYERTNASKWIQKPSQKYHELWKLMAQISFGVYLLLNGIARDDHQVMNILQGHVDEIDDFLQMTLEDFGLAQEDIEERLKFLQLPLENVLIFDAMLEDRQFRQQIVNGNERIEHVITRTAAAMKDALKDVQQGLEACREFTIYLAEEQKDPTWRIDQPEMEKVYEAMKGNVEGWHKAHVSLQTKGNHLGVALVQLGSIVAEMDRRAGEVSRKTRFSSSPKSSLSSPPSSPPPISREMRKSMLKDLPSGPDMITPAIRATLPAFQMVQDRERTPEPEAEPVVEVRAPSPEPEEYFLLQPRTYTPVPSPVPSPRPAQAQPQAPVVEKEAPPPEVSKRSSLRNRFSLSRRKEAPQEVLKVPAAKYTPEEKAKPRPKVSPVHSNFENQRPVYNTTSSAPQPRTNTTIVRNSPNKLNSPMSTPPSRGLDSAYCSDYEKPPLTQPGPHPGVQAQSLHRLPTPTQASDFPMPSPRSEHQYFRPVNASPHSPLQRPWTAAPTGHVHTHSNLSNTSNNSSSASTERDRSHSRLQFAQPQTSSQHNLRDRARLQSAGGDGRRVMTMYDNPQSRQADYNDSRRDVQSRMGMSVMSSSTRQNDFNDHHSRRGELQSRMGQSMMSDMTTVTENGKKVKKKRSAFGWLKKAFALSEEEKAAFEERKRTPIVDDYQSGYFEPPQRRWVDGKRVDANGMPSPSRSEFSRRTAGSRGTRV